MGIVSKKLRDSARGEECTFNIIGHCVGGTETTVLCHAPSEIKGIGTKSHDYWAAFGCAGCHRALDERLIPVDHQQFYWLRGIARTWVRWIERGLVIIPVDPETAKRGPKRKAKWPSKLIPSRPFQNKRKERA